MGNRFADRAVIKDEVAKAEYAIGVRKYDLALSLMQQALQENPGNCLALQTIARIYVIKGNYPAAQEAALEALRQDPRFPEAHNIYALSAQHMQFYEQAEQAFRQAIELKPIYHNAHYNYSDFLLSIRKNTSKAKEHCLKAMELSPTAASYYQVLARIYVEESDLQQAEEIYLQGLSLDPENITLHNNYGAFLLSNKRDPGAAFEHFRIALMQNPTDDVIRKNLFLTLRAKNRFYWLFWQYALLRRKLKGKFLFVILAIGMLVNISWNVVRNHPSLFQFSWVIIFVYFLFLVYIFTIDPLFTFLIKRGWIR